MSALLPLRRRPNVGHRLQLGQSTWRYLPITVASQTTAFRTIERALLAK